MAGGNWMPQKRTWWSHFMGTQGSGMQRMLATRLSRGSRGPAQRALHGAACRTHKPHRCPVPQYSVAATRLQQYTGFIDPTSSLEGHQCISCANCVLTCGDLFLQRCQPRLSARRLLLQCSKCCAIHTKLMGAPHQFKLEAHTQACQAGRATCDKAKIKQDDKESML